MARAHAVPRGVGWGFRQTMVGLAALAAVLPLSQLTASEVPAGAVPVLSATRGVDEVSSDAHIKLVSLGGYDPNTDGNSLYDINRMTGAQSYWKAGFTGKGVDVALLDTGVVPVDGLTA